MKFFDFLKKKQELPKVKKKVTGKQDGDCESNLPQEPVIKKTSLFQGCGAVSKQLEADVRKMRLPEGFLKIPYILPLRYGYNSDTKRYFVSEPMERSNDWYTLFENEDPEAFRWYMLEYLAMRWGVQYEKDHRSDLGKDWQKVRDKYVDQAWTYCEHKNAKFHAVYDHRKEQWQEAVRALSKVYGLEDERMQKYIEKRLKNLQSAGSAASPIHWHFDEKTMEFTGIRFTEEEDFVKHITKLFDITVGERPYEVMESVWMDRRNGMVYHLVARVRFGAGVWAEEDYGDPITYKKVQELANREGTDEAMKYADINFLSWKKLIGR